MLRDVGEWLQDILTDDNGAELWLAG